MPWTEKQLRLFRAAAHNPEIAKRTGIKQSDAERMSKEGLKKMAGGGEAKQKILRQDTRHGKVDMPFAKLGRFAGMKKGGFMKKRHYDEGGDIERLGEEGATQSFGDAFKEARGAGASTFTWRGKKYTTEMAKPAAKPAAKEESGPKEDAYSKASKQSVLGSPGKYLSAPLKSLRERMASGDQQAFRPRDRGFRKGGATMRSKKDIEEMQDRMGNAATFRRGGIKKMAKGGSVDPVIERGERHLKHGEHAVQERGHTKGKNMKKGGHLKEVIGPRSMKQDVEGGYKAKHLKHGEHSEQKRGHTKGTVIKMAAGGSVRAHGEHSIQLKGHTRGKVC